MVPIGEGSKSETLIPKPQTERIGTPKPQTPNPKPQTPNAHQARHGADWGGEQSGGGRARAHVPRFGPHPARWSVARTFERYVTKFAPNKVRE